MTIEEAVEALHVAAIDVSRTNRVHELKHKDARLALRELDEAHAAYRAAERNLALAAIGKETV